MQKKNRTWGLLCGAVLCLLMAMSSARPAAAANQLKGWGRQGNYFYYFSAGEKVKGFRKIDGKYYYFDRNGKQRTGWRKIGKQYRYFRVMNGKKGCMVTGKTVNGVTIAGDGAAKVTSNTSNKLKLMVRFQKLADKLVSPGMNKKKKLVVVFKYARDKKYRSIGSPPAKGRWDEKYAEMFLDAGYADCIIASCGFAYLANAVGYEKICVRLYGHCHCEIGDLIYDPGFAQTVSDANYTMFFGRTHRQLAAHKTGSDIPKRVI